MFLQIRACRCQINPKIWSRILQWEHKIIKSFVSHFTVEGGIAVGIGNYSTNGSGRTCYLRVLDTGSLTSISRSISGSNMFLTPVVTDTIMAATDYARLQTSSLKRSDTNTNLLSSFQQFTAHCTDSNMFAYICTATGKGGVVVHCHGLTDSQKERLRLCIDDCIRRPVTDTSTFTHDMVVTLPESPSLQQQFDVVNTVPAQCFQQRKHEDSLGIALAQAWPATAPKFLLLQSNATLSTLLASYCTTIGTKVEQRKTSAENKGKRKRRCKLHHLFLRKVQEATRTDTVRKTFGVSTMSFNATMTPLESFQVLLTQNGLAKVISFTDHDFSIVWSNFDTVKSKR